MKNILIIFSLIFLSAQAFAAKSSWSKNLTAYKLVKTLDPQIKVRYPEKMKKTKIQDLRVHKNTMSFVMDKSQIQLTLIGSKDKFFILNGMPFSYDEVKDIKTIQDSLVRKFGLRKPHFSILNLFINSAFAEEYLPFSRLPVSSMTPAQPATTGTAFNGSGQNGSSSDTQSSRFGNFSEFLACMTGGCFQQRLIGISSFLEAITQFAINDRGFNEFTSMPDPTLVPKPNFSASPYSVR